MKANDEWINVSNYLIKQGNSYCIRIPSSVVKDMRAEEGDAVVIKVKKFNPELTAGALEAYYGLARRKKPLDKFSREKIMVLGTLLFNEGKLIRDVNSGKQMRNESEGKKMLKVMNSHREQIKRDFGEKTYNDYLFFVEQITEGIPVVAIKPSG